MVDVNDQFIQMLGYRREELIGRPVADLVAAESRPLVEKMIREGQEGPYEHLALRKDGGIFPVEVQARTFSSGKRQLRVTSIRDVNARKQAQQELQMASESLRRTQEQALLEREEFTQRLISAQEQERTRLANELHDSLGQNLSVIQNHAHLALKQRDIPPAATIHLQAISRCVSECISETRGLARNLRPLQIEQLGLTDSLGELIANVRESTSIQFSVRLENVDDVVKGENRTHLYRILQEALNNLIKHSGANRAEISLERDVRCLRLRVRDDGRGFDLPGAPAARGLGLTSIQERARMLGGSAKIQSAAGAGTRLEIEMPIGEV